jgi:hypothetical protein
MRPTYQVSYIHAQRFKKPDTLGDPCLSRVLLLVDRCYNQNADEFSTLMSFKPHLPARQASDWQPDYIV